MADGRFEKGSARAREAGSRGGQKGGGHKFASGTAAAEAGRRGAYVRYLKYLTTHLQQELSDGKRAREAREALDSRIDASLAEQAASGRAQRKSALSAVRGLARSEKLADLVGVAGGMSARAAQEDTAALEEMLGMRAPAPPAAPSRAVAEAEALLGADPEFDALTRELLSGKK